MAHAFALEETIDADEDDTIVVDPDEILRPALLSMPEIAIPRVPTAELTVQVNVMGQWHRRTPDLKETACGVPYHGEFYATRREVLSHRDGELCDVCFTPHEILRGIQADAEALAAEEEAQRKRDAEAAEKDRKAKEASARAMATMTRNLRKGDH